MSIAKGDAGDVWDALEFMGLAHPKSNTSSSANRIRSSGFSICNESKKDYQIALVHRTGFSVAAGILGSLLQSNTVGKANWDADGYFGVPSGKCKSIWDNFNSAGEIYISVSYKSGGFLGFFEKTTYRKFSSGEFSSSNKSASIVSTSFCTYKDGEAFSRRNRSLETLQYCRDDYHKELYDLHMEFFAGNDAIVLRIN